MDEKVAYFYVIHSLSFITHCLYKYLHSLKSFLNKETVHTIFYSQIWWLLMGMQLRRIPCEVLP